MKRHTTISAIAMALTFSATQLSAAPIPAISVNTGTVGLTNWTLGWTFSTSTDINVTHLGKFDANGGGLAADVQVGLYSVATNSLITSTTVFTTSPSEANGSYNAYFAEITPVFLTAGDYFVATTDQGNDSFVRNTGFTTAPEITWGIGRADGGNNSVLQAAVTDYGTTGTGYWGATFKYEVAPTTVIPEPTSLSLGIIAMGALSMRRRRG